MAKSKSKSAAKEWKDVPDTAPQEPSPNQLAADRALQPRPPYNPLTEAPVIDKPANVNINPALLQQPIAEDIYVAPPVENEVNPLGDAMGKGNPNNGSDTGLKGSTPPASSAASTGAGSSSQVKPQEEEPKTTKEIGNDAAQLAGFIFDMYQKGHNWANGAIQISQKKLMKLQEKGELDLRAMVPYESDQWMSVREYTQAYNDQMKDFFSIDPDWRGKTEPPLTRILAKKGLGMTDEMLVVLNFSTDIGFKAKLFFDAKAQTNSVISFAVEQTKRMSAVHMSQRPAPQPAPAPQQEAPVVNMNIHQPAPQQQTHYQESPAPVDMPYNQPSVSNAPMQDHALDEMLGARSVMQDASVQTHSLPVHGNAKNLAGIKRHSRTSTAKPKKSASKKR